MTYSSRIHLQRGATLVETMVGLTIGLLVAIAAVGTVVVMRQSGTTVTESYRLTSTGNNAMRLLAMTIRQAGAMDLDQPNGQGSGVMFQPMNLRAANATGDQIVSGTEGAANATDTLVISYQHRDANVTRDCLGNSPGAPPERIDNTFRVNSGELRCLGRRGIAGTNIAAEQALVGDSANSNTEINVVDFQVWYWVQNAAGQQRRLTATDVPGNGGWPAVDAIEICLHLSGFRTDYQTGNVRNCQDTSVANGGRLHQIFRGTYKLRNRVA